jgi:ribonuclease D
LVSLARAPAVITHQADLPRVVRAAMSAPLIALDVEGNGLFAYRSRLCMAQLAWDDGGATEVAIIDTLALDPTPLRELLGRGGPAKVLHDFTFDLKLLADAGIALDNLRDTSVLARMLGRKATGLASLLSSELGIVVAKDLQQHDWSRRPLEPLHIDYLASDVQHLAPLYEKLAAEARALDIEEEVEVECAFKYDAALAPPREKRPSYLRIKGADALDPPSLAVLRRLVLEREQIAELWDEPPFKVAGNELLLALARSKPASLADFSRARRGVSSRLLEVAPRFISAVLAGLTDGSVPGADLERAPRFDREVMAARRTREKRLSAWRRTEAKARGVDEQVVLPGHCLSDLVSLETTDVDAVARVQGLGQKRIARYAVALAAMLTNAGAADPSPSPEPGP